MTSMLKDERKNKNIFKKLCKGNLVFFWNIKINQQQHLNNSQILIDQVTPCQNFIRFLYLHLRCNEIELINTFSFKITILFCF